MRPISENRTKVNNRFPITGSKRQIEKFLAKFDLPPKTYGYAFTWIQVLSFPVVDMEIVQWIADNEGIDPGKAYSHLSIMARCGLIVLWDDKPEWEEHLHRDN